MLSISYLQQPVPLSTQAHADIDFALTFGSNGIGDGQFTAPSQITENSTHFLIGDLSNNDIQVFNLDGSFADSWSVPNPIGISVNETHILATEGANNKLNVYDLSGNQVDSFTDTSLDFRGMTANDTHIFVGDATNDVVNVFDRALNHVETIGIGLGTANGQFNNPWTLHMNGSHILVADRGNNRVQILDTAGNYLDQFASSDPFGITTTVDGNIVVADFNGDTIYIYDASGNFINNWGFTGTTGGSLDGPRNTHYNGSHILITEARNDRVTVVKYTPDVPNVVTETTTETSNDVTTETHTLPGDDSTDTTTETVISTITPDFSNTSEIDTDEAGFNVGKSLIIGFFLLLVSRRLLVRKGST